MSECPICGASKAMNCDCTRKEREQHSELEELQEELISALAKLKNSSICELAADNFNLKSYMTEWENRATKAEAKCAEMRVQSEGIAIRLEAALASLADAGAGKAYDPSWCRPKSMSREEIGERCIQAYHQIWHALETLRKPS